MADVVFFYHVQFSHCFVQLRDEKDRVIAKAAATAFCGDDLAEAISLGKYHFTGWFCDGNRGMEMSFPWAGLVF